MTYNQQRHIQLLKRSQDFKNQGKSFYKERPEESLELSNYNIAVQYHLFWEQRFKVSKLMQDFLHRKIDGEEFSSSVFGLRRNLRQDHAIGFRATSWATKCYQSQLSNRLYYPVVERFQRYRVCQTNHWSSKVRHNLCLC